LHGLDSVGPWLIVGVARGLGEMARIQKFLVGDRDVKPPQSEVDGYVQKVIAEDGTVYLYLYNYAEGGPKPGASPTQSLHFDYTAAKAFRSILDETFGAL
jgi:hypothetical protein